MSSLNKMFFKQVINTLIFLMIGFILLVIEPPKSLAGNGPTWTKKGDHQALDRYEHTTVVFNSNIWVLGGCNSGSNCIQNAREDIWYSNDGKNWFFWGNAPWGKAYGLAAAVFKNKLYIIGGHSNNNPPGITSDVWEFNGASWSKVATLPEPRAGATAVAGATELYLYGGTSSSNKVFWTNNGRIWNSQTTNNFNGGASTSWRPPIIYYPYSGRIIDIGFNPNWATNRDTGYVPIVYGGDIWRLGGLGLWVPPDRGALALERSCLKAGEVGDAWDDFNWSDQSPPSHPAGYWYPIHQPGVVLFENQMWVIGGQDVDPSKGGFPIDNRLLSRGKPSAWNSAIVSGNLPTPCPAPPYFSISASPPSQSVSPGGTTGDYTVTATPKNGFTGTVSVSFSNLSGQGITYTPASLNITITGSSPASAPFRATTVPATSPGNYTIDIRGTCCTPLIIKTTSVQLVVSSGPDFSITASPPSQTVIAGSTTGDYTVTITPKNNFNSPVTVGFNGLPASSTASPASLTFNPPYSSQTFKISTQPNTPARNYVITIIGASGNLTRVTTVDLVVTQPGYSITKSKPPIYRYLGTATSTQYQSITYSYTSATGLPISIKDSLSSSELTLANVPNPPVCVAAFGSPVCSSMTVQVSGNDILLKNLPTTKGVKISATISYYLTYIPTDPLTCLTPRGNQAFLLDENNIAVTQTNPILTDVECIVMTKKQSTNLQNNGPWVSSYIGSDGVGPGAELMFQLQYRASWSNASQPPIQTFVDNPQSGQFDAFNLRARFDAPVGNPLGGQSMNPNPGPPIKFSATTFAPNFAFPMGTHTVTFFMKVKDTACVNSRTANNEAYIEVGPILPTNSPRQMTTITSFCQLKIIGDVGTGSDVNISRLAITGPAVVAAGQNINVSLGNGGAIDVLVRQLLNYSTPSVGTNSWLEEFSKAKGRLKLEFATNWSGSMTSGQVDLKGLGGNQHGVVKMDVRTGNRWRVGVGSVTFIHTNPALAGGGTVILSNRPPGSNAIELGTIDNQTGAPIALIVDDNCPSTGGLTGPKITFSGSNISIGSKDNPVALVAPCSTVDFGPSTKVIKMTGLIVAGEIKNANNANVSGSIKFDQKLITNPPPGLEQLLKAMVGEGAP